MEFQKWRMCPGCTGPLRGVAVTLPPEAELPRLILD